MASASVLLLRRGVRPAPAWPTLLPAGVVHPHPRPPTATATARRTFAFRPRRTPPPSVAGVNLRPRPNPLPPTKTEGAPMGGRGKDPAWISPHHTDYYNRLDDTTMALPELLHGDPHMPVQRLTRGDGRVALDPFGGKAREIDVQKGGSKGNPLVAEWEKVNDLEEYLAHERRGKDADDKHGGVDAIERARRALLDDPSRVYAGDKNIVEVLDEYEDIDDADLTDPALWRELVSELNLDLTVEDDDDDDDVDELEWEYGSDAADAIRGHLSSFKARMDGAGDKATYSPLAEVEERLRTIDRLTAAEGSTQDLALKRRSKTESREFYRRGDVPQLGDGAEGGGSDFPYAVQADGTTGEVGKGRLYSPDAVFGPSNRELFPYGEQPPSPTYHPDFPEGSGVGNSPVDLEEEPWMHELNRMISEEQHREMELGEIDETYAPVAPQKEEVDQFVAERKRRAKLSPHARDVDDSELEREEKPDEILEMIRNGEDPNREAYGPWGECTIKVDRVQKVERGGTTVRYRALVIGGNGAGAAGFGVGKALSPNDAIEKACKHCKRNVFYVDRYLNSGLSYDLAGRHNSCKVELRAVKPDHGLMGNPLICEILKYAGVADATAKSHGNRNPYNVVYATFKALQTHESLEEIAMKRGKKLLNLRRARRLGHA